MIIEQGGDRSSPCSYILNFFCNRPHI